MIRGGMSIRINLSERRLYLYQGEALFGSYLIAIGKPSTPSPVGNWSIVNKSILSGREVYGTRWMGLSKPRYGIHGNNNSSVIGKAVSLGCIRMYNEDIEKIFPIIPIGTPVEIISGHLKNQSNSPHPITQKPSQQSSQTPLTYTIKKGDTLWEIAQESGHDFRKIVKLNPSVNPKNLLPGQIIILP